ASLADIPDGSKKAEGIWVGQGAATAVLELRAADGWNASASYTPAHRPGRWVPTPPAFAAPLGVQWGRVKPFALQSADQFRAAPPPALDSAAYVRDLREVFELGGTGATRRTPEVANAARFWIVSGMQGWNPAARQVSAAKRLTLSQNARLLALLNIAMADALIACWDSKFAYDTWRPVTAIKIGGYGVTAGAGWTPLIATPPFPAYPSGHACAADAARVVLDRFLGPDGHSITLTSPTAPGGRSPTTASRRSPTRSTRPGWAAVSTSVAIRRRARSSGAASANTSAGPPCGYSTARPRIAARDRECREPGRPPYPTPARRRAYRAGVTP
ncbi:MAG: vanadium-dependent haloperoxidase, partial [Candidatus Rokuibacteriota bacterium]